jgi:putative heme degradation protein
MTKIETRWYVIHGCTDSHLSHNVKFFDKKKDALTYFQEVENSPLAASRQLVKRVYDNEQATDQIIINETERARAERMKDYYSQEAMKKRYAQIKNRRKKTRDFEVTKYLNIMLLICAVAMALEIVWKCRVK